MLDRYWPTGSLVESTADNDSEIGARLGVCFTFIGKLSTKASLRHILNCSTGIGGLIGTTLPFFTCSSETKKFDLLGLPIEQLDTVSNRGIGHR